MLAGLSILASCQSEPGSNDSIETMNDTIIPAPGPAKDAISSIRKDTVPYNIQIDTVIHFSFPVDSSSVSTKGSINKDADPVNCYFQVKRKGKLKATITPEDNHLNIRFSQIIMPDSTSDGPFGRQIQYDLKQSGTYKLIIAPNTMAEGKKSGDFTVRLEIR